jgi:glutathione synthase/RimK-type ligase-like ATP-grasp enzyme
VCIVRSTWDWHLHPEEFRAWILRSAARTRLVNTAKTLLWGLDKRYLLALQAAGLPIVPTAVLDHIDEIRSIAAQRGWSRVVVKPVLGASAFQTRLIDARERGTGEQPLVGGTVLVQPFLEEVCRDGEISVVVIGGRAMHAVRKRPAPGDFRVQVEHGGYEEVVPLDGDLKRLAEACWAAVPGPPTYARIDVIITSLGPRIIECEVVEPELFLDRFPAAASALAEAVCSQLTDSGCVRP